jgi:hypothetical protein
MLDKTNKHRYYHSEITVITTVLHKQQWGIPRTLLYKSKPSCGRGRGCARSLYFAAHERCAVFCDIHVALKINI